MVKIATLMLALLLAGCSVHNYKITSEPTLKPDMSVGAIEYFCAETCFKTKGAFSTGKIELNMHTYEVTCYCKKRTTDYSGDFE